MHFTEIAIAKPFEGAPKINLAGVLGASPNKPILIRIPVVGERPITFTVKDLPNGLKHENNIISGKIEKEGDYTFTIITKNKLGKDEKTITIEIGENKLQPTPLMGFTSWNAFGFKVSQEMIERVAQKMLDSGISEYGYNYINTDSGWQGDYGGKHDAVMPNEKFPDIKGMVDKFHKEGFKCGIYSSPMKYCFGCDMDYNPLPPGCTQGERNPVFSFLRGGIGLIRKEANNVKQWEEWGFDYLKYDWHPCDPYNAEIMREELIKSNRDFTYCVTITCSQEYHTYWDKYCSSYRCNGDSFGTWEQLLDIYKTYFNFLEFNNKGHWFDLDMLDTGKCEYLEEFLPKIHKEGPNLTEDEAIMSYSIRAFFNSPIQISSTLDTLNEFELSLYCNDEVIALNQDTAFSTAKPLSIIEKDGVVLHTFKKKLSDGNYAIAIFNMGEKPAWAKIYLDKVSTIRDVWAKKDFAVSDNIGIDVMPHTVRIFKIFENKL